MSIARHHAEWLSLVPVSGPFLSLPVLIEAFNTGLEPHDPEVSRLLRQAYAEWQEASEKKTVDPAAHRQWIWFVLTRVLDLDDRVLIEGQAIPQTLQTEVAEHHELLRPSMVVVDPNSKKPRLLVQVYPRSQELSSYVAGSRWKASPDTRMTELLHATGVRLGLVTNGEQWMLVDAPKGETSGYASWYAETWLEEPITLRAFRSLLSANRFFNVPDDQTLEALLTKSASNQQEVTEQLGYQVRRAVEVLIHSLDKADQDYGRELLADVTPEQLYESALTVMMRLVFLFCAEERELIPSKPFPVYEQNYSVSTISKQLRELADQQGEELLERRHDAWPRLLAAFRAVYGGLKHDEVHIPAYGGNLFNPDRFPFLEGRKLGTSWREMDAAPLPVNNRTVLHLLEALQLLQIKVPGGGPAEARRLSFRALDIEQIGHVYEGLLDHTAKRATEPFLGLAGTRSKEPEIPLAELEKRREKGDADLIKFLKEETGKTPNALEKALKAELESAESDRFRSACQNDEALWNRVKPFAGFVRTDNFGYPVVIPAGSVFVTAGTDRRSSGTHYTPRSLTEPIVQYTLEPLVYIGPAEGKPKSEWVLKPAKELLELKICDMACGSGAFLVQAARYMAERLLEAWHEAKKSDPTAVQVTPEGRESQGKQGELPIPTDPAERKTYAMRIIAQRCLYGVDINPLAAEMAKLSLWLLTLAKDKPFEFLDHSIRCGDSLVGVSNIDQLRHFNLKPDADDAVLFGGPFEEAVEEAITLRLKLEDLAANTIEDVREQERLLKEANDRIARLRYAADLLVAAEFWGDGPKGKQEKIRHAAVKAGHYVEKGPTEEFEQVAAKERRGQKMFHWPLEFPEVIVKRRGFDAFVGNPPFVGGRRIRRTLGLELLTFLTQSVYADASGNADLCAFFFRRAASLVSENGVFGFLASNTIAQGDTKLESLESLRKNGFSIIRAVSIQQWPGVASVQIAMVWIARTAWNGAFTLDSNVVSGITTGLTEAGAVAGQPAQLAENKGISFQGSIVLGTGFIISSEQAHSLKRSAKKNSDVLFPYLRGDDFLSHPHQQPTDFVINFFDWPLDRKSAAPGYVGSVAADFPQCLDIVERLVKPERTRRKDSGDFALRKPLPQKWWIYADKRPALYSAISELKEVLFHSFVSKYVCFDLVPAKMVFAGPSIVVASDSCGLFAVLQSSFHDVWAREYGSTMGNTLRYANGDVFETFSRPKPAAQMSLEHIGTRYRRCRKACMDHSHHGLTATYNRFHECDESSTDIQQLRDLHVEMDQAVANAYGWTDLDLGHGFHETKQGVRFTISEPARREVLQRLLKLNHERYAEEVRLGLHKKKPAKSTKTASGKAPSKQAAALFDENGDE